MKDVDYLATGTVITMDAARSVIRDGAVAVEGDRIVAVGPAEAITETYRGRRVLGGKNHYVTPGFIDCHNHLSQALVRDYAAEDHPNIHRIYIPAEQAMDTDDVRTSARVAIAQLLRSGVTTVAETTATQEHEDVIGHTVKEAGIRCALARGRGDRTSRFVPTYHQVAERSTFEDDPARLRDDLAASESFLARWAKQDRGLVRPWLHNQGIVSSSDERYVAVKALADDHRTGVMTHINRDREDIELSMSLFGERPIEHMHHLGVLGPNFVAIHAMLTTDREVRMLAGAGSKVAHAPVVCADLVSAVTKVVTMREWGVTVGLGCDTVINDLLKVMRIAVMMQAATTGVSLYDPTALTSQDAFAMATREAARVLLWDDEIGSLEPDKAADVVIIDGNNVRLAPSYDPVVTLVRYASGSDVRSVLVAGRIVVDEGHCTTIDEEALIDEAVRLHEKLGEVLLPRRYRGLATGGNASMAASAEE